ncbi:MAG: hypothetical protein GY726_02505, partial [Proteobacteria bacterium]|nr:hypothetical protein [Pseudomonadota bacterium]
MKITSIRNIGLAVFFALWVSTAGAECLDCHALRTPNIVSDWFNSGHRVKKIGCEDCHGSSHTTDDDVHKVEVVTPETCAESSCHEKQVRQYRR